MFLFWFVLFCFLNNTLNSHNGQGWAMQKPSVCSCTLISPMNGRNSSTWVTFHCNPRCIIREMDQSSQESNWHSHMECFWCRQWLSPLHYKAGSSIQNLRRHIYFTSFLVAHDLPVMKIVAECHLFLKVSYFMSHFWEYIQKK